MDGDSGTPPRARRMGRAAWLGGLLGLALLLGHQAISQHPGTSALAGISGLVAADSNLAPKGWQDYLPLPILIAVACLVACSAFFSGSESAFFSISKLRLRAMREDDISANRLVARMLDEPGRLLTTILVGNMIVNTLIGIFLGSRVETLLLEVFKLHDAAAYAIAVAGTTLFLVLLGEVSPKVFAINS